MIKGKIFKIIKAPHDWEIIQQNDGFADINVAISVSDNENDDTEFEVEFSLDNIYARVVNEETGVFVTPLIRLECDGSYYGCNLEKVPCGGPYLLDFIIFDREKGIDCPMVGARRRHFFVGDVYIIVGQSNAAGMGKGYITEQSEMGIHILRNLEYWDIASSPFNDFDYSKQSMFMAFAKHIRRQAGIPVGLIPAAMGGSTISRWLKNENGDLYRKMIAALNNHNIKAKAVIWYQGCGDTGGSTGFSDYLMSFRKFTEFLRDDLGNKNLPIFTFQLNRQKNKENTETEDFEYDCIREAQRRAAKEIKNVYILPAIDALNMSDFIHCSKSSNIMLGERLAIQVLDKLYKIGNGADAPEICAAHFSSEKEIKLEFNNVSEFLYGFNSSVGDFPIKVEDDNGIADISDYDIIGNTVTVCLKQGTVGETFVSGQSGSNPKNIIIDYGTQIPMLCFNKFKVEKVL